MKDIFFVYDQCCLYELMVLRYFMRCAGGDAVLLSADGAAITSAEGIRVTPDGALGDAAEGDIRCIVVPGGFTAAFAHRAATPEVLALLGRLRRQGTVMAGICAGVDVLEMAGVLEGVASTHSRPEDLVADGPVITARANAYVDFAIAVAKALSLFADEQDLVETLAFWKGAPSVFPE